MDELAARKPVTLVKRRFNLAVEVAAEFGHWHQPVVEMWRDALEVAGGRPFEEPAVHFSEINDHGRRTAIAVGMALVTPEMADRLDAEVGR